jgi:DNA adenine methylase
MKNSSTLRSPLFYVGDKFKLIEEIKTYFPTKINSFVEPFVGGGSVFLNVEAENYILNDIDKNVIALHKFLCSYSSKYDSFIRRCFQEIDSYGFSCSLRGMTVPEELKSKYKKTYYAEYYRQAYLSLRDDYNNSNRRNLFQLYLLLIYGFNHMIRFNASGNFNLPVGNVDFNQNVDTALRGYFQNVQSKSILWSSLDFKKFFKGLNLTEDDFVYLDPPYLITFSEYNKLWTPETERDLLSILDALNEKHIKFAISNVTHYKGKENTIFIEWARKYNEHNIKSNYISYHDNSVKNFQEVLVTNY